MFCSISGNVPEEPVVDKTTGHLYERRLVVKYIQVRQYLRYWQRQRVFDEFNQSSRDTGFLQETGNSPVTGEILSEDDLVRISSNQEWDALMLETHSLRQSLGTVRQELSQAYYQHDASVRIIARLIRERDEARAALESASLAAPEDANGKRVVEADADGIPAKRAKGGITPDIVEAMTKHSGVLSKLRKKRQIPETLATPEEVADLSLAGSFPLHKTTQGGILALDVEPTEEKLIFSAGVDHTGQIYDRAAGRILTSLKGHSKKVTDIKVMKGGLVITTSADKSARVWTAAGEGSDYSCSALLKDHAAEVSAVAPHVTGDFFVTTSLDKTWCFYDVATATCLQQISDETLENGYTCAQFHPDGLILGTGSQGADVRIWEIRQQKSAAQLSHGAGAVSGVSFSENGYYLATSASEGVKLWDLRKLVNFKSLDVSGGASCVAFDHSGLFLAVGGAKGLNVHAVKQDWNIVKSFGDLPRKGVHITQWGRDAKTLFVGAADHNLRVFESTGAAPME